MDFAHTRFALVLLSSLLAANFESELFNGIQVAIGPRIPAFQYVSFLADPLACSWNLSSVNCRNRSSGNGPEPIQTLVLPSVMSESLSVMSEFPRGTCGRIEEKKDRIRNARFFKQSIMLTFNRVFNPAISLTLFI